ncbi:hypothetical protein COOONC_03432 [Cooperia oncophora]
MQQRISCVLVDKPKPALARRALVYIEYSSISDVNIAEQTRLCYDAAFSAAWRIAAQLLSKAAPIGVKCRDRVERLLQRLFRRRNLSRITSFLPILTWLPHYDWSHSFFGDLSGGLTMAVFSVPQVKFPSNQSLWLPAVDARAWLSWTAHRSKLSSTYVGGPPHQSTQPATDPNLILLFKSIALAGITGVPPVYGLYTAIFPSFLYIFFGTSKHNALGGFAVLSLMTHTAIEKVMMRTAISYNATSYVNHTIEELDPTLDGLNGTSVWVTLPELLYK